MIKRNGLWIDRSTFIEFADKTPSSLSAEIATRARSLDYYGIGMYLPNPDPVLKKTGQDIKVYEEMLSDAFVSGCVTSRQAGVKSLDWQIDRGKAQSRQAKLITGLFNGFDMDRILTDILRAPLFGYEVLEVIWEKAGDYWLPADIIGKPQHWFCFYADDNSLRFKTKENIMPGEVVPKRKFIVARRNASYANPYGVPILSSVFWPLTFKKGGFKFWIRLSEKYGMPFLWGKLPRGLEQKEYDNLADMLESMIQDAVAVTPDDASVEMMVAEGKGAQASIYKDLIETCKTEISISILGQNLTTEVKGGSLAASETHMRVREEIVEADKKIVERVFNTLIGWIYELNFGSGERPTFGLYQEEDVDKTLAERDGILSQQVGVKFTPQYITREYGFEEGDIESVGGPQGPGNGGPGPATAEFAEGEKAKTPVDGMVMRAAAQAKMDGILGPIQKMIDDATSMEDLRDRILSSYKDLSAIDLGNLMQRAFAAAELAGRFDVGQEQGNA